MKLQKKRVYFITISFIFTLFVVLFYPGENESKAANASSSSPPVLASHFTNSAPKLDGIISKDEWVATDFVQYPINLVEIFTGKITKSVKLSVSIKNDDKNLYIAGILDGDDFNGEMTGTDISTLLFDSFTIAFDNNDNGIFQTGEDKKSLYIVNGVPFVKDAHHVASGDSGNEEDEKQDISGNIIYKDGRYSFEVKVPFKTSDTFDISIKQGQKIRFNILFFEKFTISLKGTSIGGLFGNDIDNSKGWGYIQIAPADTAAPPPLDQQQKASLLQKLPNINTIKLVGIGGSGGSLDTNQKGDVNLVASITNESDITDERLTFIGSHYDLILLSFPFKNIADKLRTLNPGIRILLFNNPYFSFGDKFWNAASTNEANRNIEAFALKTSDDKIIHYNGPTYSGLEIDQQNVPLMAFNDPNWQQYFALQTQKYVQQAGLDGVFIDTLGEEIPPFAITSTLKYPKGYTAKSWKKSSYDFLNLIKKKLGNSLIFFNGVSREPNNNATLPNLGMLKLTDGTAIEAYSVYMAMDTNESTKRWFFDKTIMEDMKQVLASGKYLVLEVDIQSESVSSRLYALASYLLLQNDRSYFYLTGMDNAGKLRWLPEWSVKLGTAAGEYHASKAGGYYRDFQNGKVVVNPTQTKMTIPLNKLLYNSQRKQISSLDLPPFSGAILVVK